MSSTGRGRGGAPARAVHSGAQRRTVVAIVNLFKISLDRMGSMVYQYDGSSSHLFSFTPISHYIQSVSGSLTLRITEVISFLDVHELDSDIDPEIKAKRRIFEIIDTVQSNNPQIFRTKPAFDGMKNIFSFKPLFPGGGEGVFTCRPEGAVKEYTVTIRLVAEVEAGYYSSRIIGARF